MSTNGKYLDDTGIPFPAPVGGVLSGGYFMHGNVCCVARADEATAGDDVACDTRGVFTLPKAGVAVTAGDELYDSAGSVTNVQSGTLQPIGCAFADALIGATTVEVILNKGIEADSDVGTLTANLAATTVGKGGDLIGLFDGGGIVTATTCGAAIIENRGALDTLEGVAATTTASAGAGYVMQSAGADLSIEDGTMLAADLVTASAVIAAGNLVIGDGGAKDVIDSTVAATDLPTMAAVAAADFEIITAGGNDRSQKAALGCLLHPAAGGAGAKLELPEETGSGTNTAAIQAPATLAADIVVTLPTASVDMDDYLQVGEVVAEDAADAFAGGADGASALPFVVEIDGTAVAADGVATMPRKGRIIDVWAISKGANGGGTTVTLRDAAAGGGNALSSALAIVADNDFSRTTTFDHANGDIASGASIYANKTNAADDCVTYVLCMPIA